MRSLNIYTVAALIAWMFLVFVSFDVALLSYEEHEIFAGKVFSVATLFFFIFGVGLYFKFKPKLFLPKD